MFDLGNASHLLIETLPRGAFFQIYSVKEVFAQFTMQKILKSLEYHDAQQKQFHQINHLLQKNTLF